ncbi:MAG: rhomboid family intramembrane serine protease [Planctomycetia bacterium]|nr:rhomboid family intramembrane serine protease [Planctomycetia bacterium]
MIPIGTDATRQRTPWMNWIIIALCFAIYFISHPHNPNAHYLGVNPGWGKFLLWRQHLHLYQFVTYLFLHANILHILGNMLFLWVFGDAVNERLGHLAYLLFFLAGGIFAGVGQVLTSGAPTLGASGAIASVAGMFLVLSPLSNIRVWFFFFIINVPSLLFVLFEIVTFDLAGEIFPGRHDDVAHFAHLTGYMTGFTVGILLLALRLVPRDYYDLPALIDRWRHKYAGRRITNSATHQ